MQLEAPFQIREERPRSSASVVIVAAAAAAAAVVRVEEVGCKRDAGSEEELLVFEAAEGHAAVAAVVAGIGAPSHREAPFH